MRVLESLSFIEAVWLNKVSFRLAKGEDLRESFEQSLNRFFELLQMAVETGDPEWVNPILNEWGEVRTQTELENLETSLPQMLNEIFTVTYEVVRDTLDSNDGMALNFAILPVFLHALQYAYRKEASLQVNHMSRELEKANETLERLDRSKSDFIAIAAHELKTPLTLIEGYAAMLRDQLPRNDETCPEIILLKGVDNGTHRLREIVDDMIDVSLIDNDLLSLNFQPLWVNRLFSVMRSEFEQILNAREQTLVVREFPGCNEMTFGDAERLYQALRKVLANAIKYTPDGGTVVVDGRRLPGFIEITIADSGIGIDPDDHTRIFEKFGSLGSVSLHSSGKTKFKGGGPGLGLPITKGIIEAHGGAIWVESPGYDEIKCPGSTFHILLPIRKTPPDDKTAKLFDPSSIADLDAS